MLLKLFFTLKNIFLLLYEFLFLFIIRIIIVTSYPIILF
jgi:hypothetical protein